MEGGIASASGEIVRLRQFDFDQKSSRLRLSRAITAIDHALEELEQLNLADCARIPEPFARQIELLMKSVPINLRPCLEHESVEVVMDDLYRAEQSLLIRRSGPEWDDLRAYEDELLPSA